jgi:hypothetical protein
MPEKTVLLRRASEYADYVFFDAHDESIRARITLDMAVPIKIYNQLGGPATLRVTLRAEPESS